MGGGGGGVIKGKVRVDEERWKGEGGEEKWNG